MPFDYGLDESKRIVSSRAWGELTDHELLSHLQRVIGAFERGVLDSTWAHIADFSEVENLDGVSSQGVREMADRNPWPQESPRVLIVPTDEEYGLARMYQILGEPRTDNLALVRSVAEAIEFIEKARVADREAT